MPGKTVPAVFIRLFNCSSFEPNLPSKLTNLIQSESWVKLGVGIENDLSILSNNYNLGQCGGGIELKNLALLGGLKHPSMKHLCEMYVGSYHGAIKSNGFSDWSGDLETKELLYASKDAIVSYKIGMEMLKPSLESIKKTQKSVSVVLINPDAESSASSTTDEELAVPKTYSDVVSSNGGRSPHEARVSFARPGELRSGDSDPKCVKKVLKTLNVKRRYTFKELYDIMKTDCTKKMEKKMLNRILYNDCADVIARIGDTSPPIWKLKADPNRVFTSISTIGASKINLKINPNINYIGKIQEYAQKNELKMPVYRELQGYAPFKMECKFLNRSTVGKAGSKKKAKTLASANMYSMLFS